MPACNFDGSILSSTLAFIQAEEGKEAPLSQYTVYLIESMVRAMFHYGAGEKVNTRSFIWESRVYNS